MMPEETEEAWVRRSIERNWKILELMDQISSKHNVTHSQIALAWLLDQPGVDSIIIGARTPQQLKDNMEAAEITLPDEELEELSQSSELPKGYPYRFIDTYGKR